MIIQFVLQLFLLGLAYLSACFGIAIMLAQTLDFGTFLYSEKLDVFNMFHGLLFAVLKVPKATVP